MHDDSVVGNPVGGRRWSQRALLVPLVVVVGLIAIQTRDSGSGGSTMSPDGLLQTEEPTTTTLPASEADAKAAYAVGETAMTGDISVTVHSFSDPKAAGAARPKPGARFIEVDIELANKGSQPRSFSTRTGVHLLDETYRQYDLVPAETSPRLPEGEIAAGRSVRGTVVFEVPDATSELRLAVHDGGEARSAFFILR